MAKHLQQPDVLPGDWRLEREPPRGHPRFERRHVQVYEPGPQDILRRPRIFDSKSIFLHMRFSFTTVILAALTLGFASCNEGGSTAVESKPMTGSDNAAPAHRGQRQAPSL